ncbi:Trehalose receptor [Popillia japonica]|uniref:Trehalose receptor n=1 Tax=Popillia japonica TaxID=7064 RepID=A0AAW1LU86_POPJA
MRIFLATFVFFFNGFVVIVLFLKLATEWPEFMRYWHNTEKFIKSKVLLPRFFVLLPFVILGAAAVEHGLFIAYCVTYEVFNGNISINGYEHFMTNDLYVFNYISYTWYLGVFLKFTSVINTFYWNFMDVFVILMSIALARMLALINERIRFSNEIKIAEWSEIRRQYNKVYELCNQLEDKISPILLLSFSSNLYFVLVQLHGSVEKRDTVMESIYFFYSFGLLLIRTLAVCLFVARIDDENKSSLRFLSCLKTFNSESKRLLQQIGTTRMALSGMNFFSVTRGLILNIAAAIVTYEIFFIQYVNTAT